MIAFGCMDLRPLNAREAKQKFPFPIIEDCIARLNGNKVFILLDFKDGFHQIKVHPDDTKYFRLQRQTVNSNTHICPLDTTKHPRNFKKE